jgi:hypothetical protein
MVFMQIFRALQSLPVRQDAPAWSDQVGHWSIEVNDPTTVSQRTWPWWADFFTNQFKTQENATWMRMPRRSLLVSLAKTIASSLSATRPLHTVTANAAIRASINFVHSASPYIAVPINNCMMQSTHQATDAPHDAKRV